MSFLTNLLGGLNVYFIPAALICITFHECAHGLAAWKLGDPTAKQQGRLSLNPFKHLDVAGFIMLVLLGFGWAKPVPVDVRYFKNPKRGMALTALAGPASNFVLAFVVFFALEIFAGIVKYGEAAQVVYNVLLYTAVVSVGLGVFNLIPLPPLDGSKMLFSFLPDRLYYTILRYERYGMFILMILMFTGVTDGPLMWLRTTVMDAIWAAAKLPAELLLGLFK